MAQKKEKLFGLLWAILFLLYNGVVAAVLMTSDIAALTPTFWVSLVFAEISLLALLVTLLVLGKTLTVLRDWFFGFPILRHCALYLLLTMVASGLFMGFQDRVVWGIALAVLLLLLAVYLLFALSCLIAKRTVQDIDGGIKEKRLFIDLLRVDAEMLCGYCEDAEAKKPFLKYAEAVRFSDPMSNEALFELEKEIQFETTNAMDALKQGNLSDALIHCDQASKLLSERNKKCKALKGLRE